MGKFSRLLQAKGKDITIGDDVFSIKPLGGKYLGLFMDMDNSDKKEGVMKELILVSLQQTDAELTLADIDDIPLKILIEIFEVISEVNELS